ncbi:MAG: PilZ domain-containing protein [Nitrospirae bacterium]|jgi:hypothetical protein|nr:PilZ domain-containing protein [Nitrospirota bacterium]
MKKLKLRNRRKHERTLLNKVIEYSMNSSSDDKSIYGIISDMSESGMCLLTTCPLKNGEKILLKIVNPLSKIAVVRWSSAGGLYYKAGLKFK